MSLCIHELDAASCHFCAPRNHGRAPASTRPDGHKLGPWFSASYAGECDGCGDPVEVGDQIRSDGDGGWLCSLCGYQDDEQERVPDLW